MYIGDYLEMGSVEAIDEALRTNMTSMTGPNGQAAVAACTVLAMRDIEGTLRHLDAAATRLDRLSLLLAGVSLIVAIVGVVVVVV